MKGGQDCTELTCRRKLHLVEEEGNACSRLLRSVPEFEQHFIKVHIELATVSPTALRVDVDRKCHADRHGGNGERSNNPESGPGAVAKPRPSRQARTA